MMQFGDLWLLMGIVIYFRIATTDSYFVSYDDDGTIPIITCENSHQVYAVACMTSSSRGRAPSAGWLGWDRNGQPIKIDYAHDKFSSATDGVNHVYLLISGAEINLENEGEKYNCFDPQNPPDQQELKSREEYAAVLHVIPSSRCTEEPSSTPLTTASFPPSTSIMTSSIKKITTPTKGDPTELLHTTTNERTVLLLKPTSNSIAHDGDLGSQKKNQDDVTINEISAKDTSYLVRFVYIMVTFVCFLLVIHVIVLFKLYRLWSWMSGKISQTIPEAV